MSRIKSTNTRPEMSVRSALHSLGFRYRLHVKGLPGTPDLVFPAKGKVVFVHGCFWHGHSCRRGLAGPMTNIDYWNEKIRRNVERDRRSAAALRRMGWGVAVVWECQIKNGERWVSRVVRFLA